MTDLNQQQINQRQRFEKGKHYIELLQLTSLPPNFTAIVNENPFGLEIQLDVVGHEVPQLPNEVSFLIYLESDFPILPPKLIYSTITGFPAIADGRDILEWVLNMPWSQTLSISDVIMSIPNFLQSNPVLWQTEGYGFEIGRFHLGNVMHFDYWMRKQGMGVFQAVEYQDQSLTKCKRKVIVVTHSSVLQFDLIKEVKGSGYLTCWVSLQSLEKVVRSKKNPLLVTMFWNQNVYVKSQQFYELNASDKLVQLLVKNFTRLGGNCVKQNPFPSLKEDDVNMKQVAHIRIKEVLNSIAIYESNYDSNVSLEMTNSLMSLYQQAIEFFSAVDDPRYQIFLDRMQILLSNDVVITMLDEDDSKQQVDSQDKQLPGQSEDKQEQVENVQLIDLQEKSSNVQQQNKNLIEEAQEPYDQFDLNNQSQIDQEEEIVETQAVQYQSGNREQFIEEEQDSVVQNKSEEYKEQIQEEYKEQIQEEHKEQIEEEYKEQIQEEWEQQQTEEQKQEILEEQQKQESIEEKKEEPVEEQNNQDQQNEINADDSQNHEEVLGN